MSIKKEPNKWTPSFLKHSGIKQDTLASAQVHACTLTHLHTRAHIYFPQGHEQ